MKYSPSKEFVNKIKFDIKVETGKDIPASELFGKVDFEFLSEMGKLGAAASKGTLGYKHRKKTKQLMSEKKLGYTRTLSSRNKQSKSVAGENNHFFGKTHSQKTREIMSEKKKELYKGSGNPNAQTLKYNGVIYSTMKDLANELNVSNYWIRKMISNKHVLRIN